MARPVPLELVDGMKQDLQKRWACKAIFSL